MVKFIQKNQNKIEVVNNYYLESRYLKNENLEDRIFKLNNCLEFGENINFTTKDVIINGCHLNKSNSNNSHLFLKKEINNIQYLVLSIPSKINNNNNNNNVVFKCFGISYSKDFTVDIKKILLYTKTFAKIFDEYNHENNLHNLRVGKNAYLLTSELEKIFIEQDINKLSRLKSTFKYKYPEYNFEEEYEILKNKFKLFIENSRQKFNSNYLLELKSMAILHDIGKLLIPSEILNLPRKLTNDEFDLIKKHTIYGKQILENIKGLEFASSIVLSHHEKWDGNGYPNNLKKYEIPMGALIISPVDVFDALITNRAYRTAMNLKDILDMTRGNYKNPISGKYEKRDNFKGNFNPIIDVFMFENIYEKFIKTYQN